MAELFKLSSTEGKEIMSISEEGQLKFNREEYPDFTADEFADKFVAAVEARVVFDGLNFKQLQEAYAQAKAINEDQSDIIVGVRTKLRALEQQLKAQKG